MELDQLRDTYNKDAKGYDWKISIFEILSGAGKLRRKILNKAKGSALEVACGTGRNFEHYGDGCSVTAVDLSSEMLKKAEAKIKSKTIHLQEENVQQMSFDDACFDTVVSTLSLCTFPDPVQAVREMKRVCKPEGLLLFVEHGISSNRLIQKIQNLFVGCCERRVGCNIKRDPVQILKDASVAPKSVHRSWAGIMFVIEA